eukprot:792867-Karenia_brevis.AAC.1
MPYFGFESFRNDSAKGGLEMKLLEIFKPGCEKSLPGELLQRLSLVFEALGCDRKFEQGFYPNEAETRL